METECEGCEFLGNDGSWPGTVMLCGHPIFKGVLDYSNAIVQWRHFNPRRIVSDECPIPLQRPRRLRSHSNKKDME